MGERHGKDGKPKVFMRNRRRLGVGVSHDVSVIGTRKGLTMVRAGVVAEGPVANSVVDAPLVDANRSNRASYREKGECTDIGP
jgi:hypothetical protein